MRTQKIMKWSFLAVMLLGNISISCTKYDTPDTPQPLCMEWLGIGAYRRYLYSYC